MTTPIRIGSACAGRWTSSASAAARRSSCFLTNPAAPSCRSPPLLGPFLDGTASMPKVSVILPSYNYARYLPERIESSLAQTVGDFELIIIDDASTDDSRAVIARYADPRIRTILCDVNGGHAYRRWNDAAREARGEFLLFAGADDTCEPTML